MHRHSQSHACRYIIVSMSALPRTWTWQPSVYIYAYFHEYKYMQIYIFKWQHTVHTHRQILHAYLLTQQCNYTIVCFLSDAEDNIWKVFIAYLTQAAITPFTCQYLYWIAYSCNRLVFAQWIYPYPVVDISRKWDKFTVFPIAYAQFWISRLLGFFFYISGVDLTLL